MTRNYNLMPTLKLSSLLTTPVHLMGLDDTAAAGFIQLQKTGQIPASVG